LYCASKIVEIAGNPGHGAESGKSREVFKASRGTRPDERGGSMAARAIALMGLAMVLGGTGLWAWSNHCEEYGLCYPACRVASNGVEYWKRLKPVIRQSEQIAASASPGSECLTLLAAMRAGYPGKEVAIDTVNMAGVRRPAPYYRYDCTFEIREPVFNLDRNAECASESVPHSQ
jgi:hypothetical protein